MPSCDVAAVKPWYIAIVTAGPVHHLASRWSWAPYSRGTRTRSMKKRGYHQRMRSLLVLGASAVVLSLPPFVMVQPAPCAVGRIYQVAGSPGIQSAAPSPGPLTVASLNIAGESRISEAVAAWTNRRDVDVLFMQEVGGDEEDGESFSAALAQRLGFASAYAPARSYKETGNAQGLAIVSRYPLDDVAVRLLP